MHAKPSCLIGPKIANLWGCFMSRVNPRIGCVPLNSILVVFLTMLVLLPCAAVAQGTAVGVSFLPRVIYNPMGSEPSFVAAADLNGGGWDLQDCGHVRLRGRVSGDGGSHRPKW